MSKKHLLNAIQTGKKQEINAVLRNYKTEQGLVHFPSVLSIPRELRIAQLAKNDFINTSMLITAGLTLAFESLNLKRGMNANQVIDLAEMIIDESADDNLAMEDLMLFLQKLVRGEYGVNYESMDCSKFMEKFEVYRQERYKALQTIRMEQHAQHKVAGDTGRTAKIDQLSEHFSSLGDRLSGMKSDISKLKEENKNLKMDKF